MADADGFAALRAILVCGLSTDGAGPRLCSEEQVADALVKTDREDFKRSPLETPSHPPHGRDCENTQQVVDGVAQPQGMFGQDF